MVLGEASTVAAATTMKRAQTLTIDDAICMAQLSIQLSMDVNNLFDTLQRYRKQASALAIADDHLHEPESLFTDNELDVFLLARQGQMGAQELLKKEGKVMTSLLRILKSSEERITSHAKPALQGGEASCSRALRRGGTSASPSRPPCKRSGTHSGAEPHHIRVYFMQELAARLDEQADDLSKRNDEERRVEAGQATTCSAASQGREQGRQSANGAKKKSRPEQGGQEQQTSASSPCLTLPLLTPTSMLDQAPGAVSSTGSAAAQTYDGLNFTMWPPTPSTTTPGAALNLGSISSLYASAISPCLQDGFLITDESHDCLGSHSSSSVFSQSYSPPLPGSSAEQPAHSDASQQSSRHACSTGTSIATEEGSRSSTNDNNANVSLQRPRSRCLSPSDRAEGSSTERQEKSSASQDDKRRGDSHRKRKRWSEVSRQFECDFPGCVKRYGTVQHLNVHRVNCDHGPRKVRADFVDVHTSDRSAARSSLSAASSTSSSSPSSSLGSDTAPSISLAQCAALLSGANSLPAELLGLGMAGIDMNNKDLTRTLLQIARVALAAQEGHGRAP